MGGAGRAGLDDLQGPSPPCGDAWPAQSGRGFRLALPPLPPDPPPPFPDEEDSRPPISRSHRSIQRDLEGDRAYPSPPSQAGLDDGSCSPPHPSKPPTHAASRPCSPVAGLPRGPRHSLLEHPGLTGAAPREAGRSEGWGGWGRAPRAPASSLLARSRKASPALPSRLPSPERERGGALRPSQTAGVEERRRQRPSSRRVSPGFLENYRSRQAVRHGRR